MKRQAAERAPSFYCFAPRPRHVELDPLPHTIYLTLRDARGIFKTAGFSVTEIRSSLVRGNVALAASITEAHILTELMKLKGLGLAEQLASAPERWRVKR